MSSPSVAPSLPDAVERYVAGELPGAELRDAFAAATVYCQRGERPGFVAVGEPGHGVVPVFSSLTELANYTVGRGEPGTDWFSTTGADVLDLLPDGYGVVLDCAGPRPLTIPAEAVGDAAVLRVTGGTR